LSDALALVLGAPSATDAEWRPTGLVFNNGITYERWTEIGGLLKRMDGALSWWWGDWCNYGERAYGEKYSQAIDDTGLAYQTLVNYAYVSRRYNNNRRRLSLTFQHHSELAFLDDDGEQDEWLDRAEVENWKKGQLQQRLRLAKQAARMAQLPAIAGTFRTIVADPPWPYENTGTRGAAEDHYDVLPDLDAIKEYRLGDRFVRDLAPADGAHLYLWIPWIHLAEGWGLEVARTWGFEPAVVLTWVKPQPGIGKWFRSASEHILFCTREALPLAIQGEAINNWFSASRGEHSEKPDAFYDLVERVSPGPHLDIFARRQRDGWTCWGDELT